MKFLYKENHTIYAKCTNCERILKFKIHELDEVKTGVECFCGHTSKRITGIPKDFHNKKNTRVEKPDIVQDTKNTDISLNNRTINGPVCPTCGSSNVQKISLSSKAVGGVMFGIFSSNIRNTFKCSNCGYKW